MKDFRKYLTENGLAESRSYDLASAFNVMHKAYCELDPWNRREFDSLFGSDIREALITYAEHCPAANAELRDHVRTPVDVEIVRDADQEDINGLIHS
jgi:hypothetical protein